MGRSAPEQRSADASPKALRTYSVILAAEVGEPAAQMFHRIWYFCTRTESGKVIDGRRWIVNSIAQWREHFPHWRALGTVKAALRILKERGLILPGNHNQKKQDRTLWYTVNFDHPLLSEAGYVEHKTSAKKGSGQKSKIDQCKGQKLTNAKVKKEPMHWSKNNSSYNNREDHQRRPSSSPGREEDGIIDEQIQKMMQAKREEHGNGNGVAAASDHESNVSPETEGDCVMPPDPSDDLLKKVYGRIPPAQDFLAIAPGSVNLWHYLRPFQNQDEMKRLFTKEEIRAMDTPGPPGLEAKCIEFIDLICSAHFKGEVRGGFKVTALWACRGGFLNRCGFSSFCEHGLQGEYAGCHNRFRNLEWSEEW